MMPARDQRTKALASPAPMIDSTASASSARQNCESLSRRGAFPVIDDGIQATNLLEVHKFVRIIDSNEKY